MGLAQVPALSAWLAWLGWSGLRSDDRRERTAGGILLGAVVLTLAFCALYVAQLKTSMWSFYTFTLAVSLKGAANLATLGLGPGAESWWPASGAFVLLVLAATLVLLATGLRSERVEIRRRLGLLASMTGAGCLVASIAIGRAYGTLDFVPRYATLTVPLLCCAHVAWTLYGGPRARALACGSIALAAWATLPPNARLGDRMGRDLRDRVEGFEERVARGASPRELVESFTETFPNQRFEGSCKILRTLAVLEKPPFDRAPAPPAEAFDYLTFSRFPSKVQSDRATYWSVTGGRKALFVHAGTAIHLHMFAGDKRISGRFGLPPRLIDPSKPSSMRILVESLTLQGKSRILLDRTLDPSSLGFDHGSQEFALEAPPELPCEIVLRTESASGPASEQSWSYWADISIE